MSLLLFLLEICTLPLFSSSGIEGAIRFQELEYSYNVLKSSFNEKEKIGPLVDLFNLQPLDSTQFHNLIMALISQSPIETLDYVLHHKDIKFAILFCYFNKMGIDVSASFNYCIPHDFKIDESIHFIRTAFMRLMSYYLEILVSVRDKERRYKIGKLCVRIYEKIYRFCLCKSTGGFPFISLHVKEWFSANKRAYHMLVAEQELLNNDHYSMIAFCSNFLLDKGPSKKNNIYKIAYIYVGLVKNLYNGDKGTLAEYLSLQSVHFLRLFFYTLNFDLGDLISRIVTFYKDFTEDSNKYEKELLSTFKKYFLDSTQEFHHENQFYLTKIQKKLSQ